MIEFVIPSVNLEVRNQKEDIDIGSCHYSSPHLRINENNFILDLKDIAVYYVSNGHNIRVFPYKNADTASINLFLNGSVLGILLHQRGILPYHGSSFELNGKGIMICGYSGTGKSSVTTAFCQNGGRFISDDITAVRIAETRAVILPLETRVKLWNDSLHKLKISCENLQRIRPALDKYYLPEQETSSTETQLDEIFILTIHNKDEYIADELNGIEKYNALRTQIYRKIYLKGMPETEIKYFRQLFSLASNVRVTRIIRPAICDIYKTMRLIQTRIR